ncbi:hypothetical protein OH799_24915 [Nocardia sp. NBC_00881]|nr:hypothetical protein OH799_24915 [Nocardia sp. NBC_00881]
MAHPEHVGKPETVLVYSGSEELFAHHERLLGQLGSATYLGPDPGTAALYDVAVLNFAWATLIGYLYSAALLRTAEVRATTTTPLLNHWMSTTIASVIADYAQQIDNGRTPATRNGSNSTHPSWTTSSKAPMSAASTLNCPDSSDPSRTEASKPATAETASRA